MNQRPAKYLVLIEAGGIPTALLFDEERRQLAEFDSGSEEVAVMTRGLVPAAGADGREWDGALGGQSRRERQQAEIFTLDV